MKQPDALEFCLTILPYVKKQIPKYRSKFSKSTYTQHQYTVLNLLRLWWDCTYRTVQNRVILMPALKEALDLETVPHWTCIQKSYAKQSTLVYRALFERILDSVNTGTIAAVDATGISRGRVSQYYTQRIGMHLKSLKTTFVVDCDHGWVLDVHMTTTRKHDTQIGPKLLRNIPESVDILTADKGYDDAGFRRQCREAGLEDQIKYREFGTGGQAEANAFLDERQYPRRNVVESFMYAMKEQFGGAVRSRRWDRQFKESVGRAIVYNVNRMLQKGALFLLNSLNRLWFSWNDYQISSTRWKPHFG